MKFLITYMRFTYHTIAMAHAKNGKPNKGIIFIGLSFLTLPMYFFGLLSIIKHSAGFSLMSWFDGIVGIVFQFQRGILTPSAVLILLVSSLLVYWICVMTVEFDNIPQKMKTYSFFEKSKFLKAFMFIASGPVFMLTIEALLN